MSESMNADGILLMVTRAGMGHADEVLGPTLLTKYLSLVDGDGDVPGVICFYGDGVKMVVEGSPVLESLVSLEAKGVTLIVCNTCLKHYGLTDAVRVGTVGGMTDIIAAQWEAAKVITL